MARADGSFKIIKKINDNAYKLELPPEFGLVSPLTFQIWSHTWEGKMSLSQGRLRFKRGDDKGITLLDTNNIQGSITRARARQLNLEVSSFLNTSLYDHEDRLLPNNCIMIRNYGEGEWMLGDGLGDVQDQLGWPSQEGGSKQVGLGYVSRSRSSLH